MGWLYKNAPIDDPVAYLKDQYNHDNEEIVCRVIDAGRVANVVYLAVKITKKATDLSYVTAIVALISNTKKDGFGYKDMGETAGPCECSCPDRIMRLLSPVEDLPYAGYAADWRASVAAHRDAAAGLRKKRSQLRAGDTVTLAHEVRFGDGVVSSVFRVHGFRNKTPIFEPIERPGYRCRLRTESIRAATIS